MASILYYLPGVTTEQVAAGKALDRDTLARFGLAETLADVTEVPKHASISEHRKLGPTGGPGVLIAPVSKNNGPPPMLQYSAGHQVWQKIPGSDAMAGYIKVDPPRSYDLERLKFLPGMIRSDDYGHAWTTPIARSPQAMYGALPQHFTFDASGSPVGVVQDQWLWLWELAGEVREQLIRGGDDDFETKPFAWLVSAALRILSVNYRLGPAEINLLAECGINPLTQSFVYNVASAVVDFDVLREAQQKKTDSNVSTAAASCSSSAPGDEAGSPATDLAGER